MSRQRTARPRCPAGSYTGQQRRVPFRRSTRSMAKHLGLSHSTIGRIWRTFGLQPHRSESFRLSQDPQLPIGSSLGSRLQPSWSRLPPIWSSVIVRSTPGLGSSYRPSNRCATKRLRHLPTVLLMVRSFLANRRRLVRGEIVEHDMDVQLARNGCFRSQRGSLVRRRPSAASQSLKRFGFFRGQLQLSQLPPVVFHALSRSQLDMVCLPFFVPVD